MSAPKTPHQLYSLDKASPGFLRDLYAFIRNDEDGKYTAGLNGVELTELVDFLDNALGSIPPSDDVFRQCLRKLRALCSSHSILPSSHIIGGDLHKLGDSAIACGGFADVWKGEHNGKNVCIKVLRISLNDTAGRRQTFFKEAVVWKRLRHPNIVPFLGVTTDPLQFVSEWMPHGTLTHYVTNNPTVNRIALLLDVAEGLYYLHASYTIHGDLKGPNILVGGNGHACLADFGLASIVHGNHSIAFTDAQGYTARWTAPEILKGEAKVTREGDVFSFGMVVMEAFTGKYPLSECTPPSVMVKIITGERPVYPRGSERLGFVAQIWNMAVNCWQHDPAHRPTMAIVVEFLRQCYTLQIEDPSLSTLSPWKPGDTSIYGVISPTLTDENSSPTQSTGTSHNLGHASTSAQDNSATYGPAFNTPFPNVGRSPESSLGGSSSGESPASSNLDSSAGVNGQRKKVRSSTTDDKTPRANHVYRVSSVPSRPAPTPPTRSGSIPKPVNADPKLQKRGEEEPPKKTGKAMWKGIAAVIRFRVFSKRASTENHAGG